MKDERLRELYQAALRRQEPDQRSRCVPAESLVALLERQGSEAERLALLDHVMACEACHAEFELLRSIHDAASPERRHEPTSARGVHPNARPLLAGAASLVLLIGGVLFVRWAGLDGWGTDVMRGGAAELVATGPASEAEVIPPVELTWRSAGAALYTVEVLDAQGDQVFRLTTADTSVVVPAAALQAGARYQWWVRASLHDGAERATVFRWFRIRHAP